MEWKLDVPKIAHFYWGGDIMSYIRYMTIPSFIKQNPDWRVILWEPSEVSVKRTWASRELNYDVQCDDYYPKLEELPIERHKVDFTEWGFPRSISEVHKSDFLRLYLLATMGGVWSDMDILYFKPMTELAVNKEENAHKESYVCISHYGHSAGFLMSTPGSAYYARLVELAKKNYLPTEYQGIGATMFNQYFPKVSDIEKISSVVNIDMAAVYAHNALSISDIIDGKPSRFSPYSIGIHWYAGHPLWANFIKNTNGGLVNLHPSVITEVLNKIR